MPREVYELQGYAIVLDKVLFVTRVFESEAERGFQFNIRFSADTRISSRYATRHEAELRRKQLIEALKGR